MNFKYSYRAFLIASLVSGNLVLMLYLFKLSSEKKELQQVYDIELAQEISIPEKTESDIAAIKPERAKIETNRAYNEAEDYISKIEAEHEKITETTQGKLAEMNEAIGVAYGTGSNSTAKKTTPQKEKKSTSSNSNSEKKEVAVVKGGNRNTTISYQLVNRRAMDLPNPVYTCESFGKVVITIKVSETGHVLETSYNSGASSTTNQCLIDSALEYAAQARFSTDASRSQQLGTITFNFPGQFQ